MGANKLSKQCDFVMLKETESNDTDENNKDGKQIEIENTSE